MTKTKIEYSLPVDKDKIIRVSKESPTHNLYKYSIDYFVPVGTPIKATADGIVHDLKDNSNKSGKTRFYEKYENFIELQHEGNEYTYYGHIKKGGAIVKLGEKVKRGQIIGYSGSTGWTAGLKPHVHFMVWKYEWTNLQIRFKKD